MQSRNDTVDQKGLTTGMEWIIDARGCFGESLCRLPLVQRFCETVVRDLTLQVVGSPQWHQFPSPGGVTGLYLLTESHLACHTFPELGLMTVNLYCCRPRREFPWQQSLQEIFGATDVVIMRVARGGLQESALQNAGLAEEAISSEPSAAFTHTAGGN